MGKEASPSGDSKPCFGKERRKNQMAEEQKQPPKDFRAFFEGTPCADMMRKMMDGKKEGQTFNCAEMMSKMTPLCRKFMGKEEEPGGKKKETPGSGQ
jgi:hypothetical protein